jgi:hypothetical protein
MEADSVEVPEKMPAWVIRSRGVPAKSVCVSEPFSLVRHCRDLPKRRGVQGRSGRVSAVPGNIGMLLFAEIGT